MKEEVLKILEESKKSMDGVSIIRKMQGDYKTEELVKLLELLENLVKEGILIRNKNNEFMLFERSNYKKGIVEITKTGNAFLLLKEEKDLFIHKRDLEQYNVMDGDLVVVEEIKIKGKKEGRIVNVLERSLDSGIGEIYFENGKPKVKLNNSKEDFKVILEETDLNLVDGLLVKLKFVKDVDKNITVRIDRIICHKNAPDVDILSILGGMDIITEFSEETLEEARNMPKEISEKDINGRIDLRSEMIFTIDGADTKDIDDAVSLKILPNGNYELGVHIADVSYYVREGSALKKEALQRGNSVYLADRVVPMLPVELSNGICSLNPEVDRFATSCVMEIDLNGNVKNYKIFKSIIKSRKKMTYEDVNKLFDGCAPEDYKEYENVLNKMLELSEILNKAKKARGEVDFSSPEIKLIVDEDGKVTEIKKRSEGKGQKLIENFMIMANVTVGNHMFNMSAPFVYRVHKSPTPEKMKLCIQFINILGHKISKKINYNNISSKDIQIILEELKDASDYEIINKQMLRSMQKAIYLDESLGHFALALKNYTHFTSPIRRYCDLMVHYFIDECYFKNNITKDFIKHWEDNLPYICNHISETEVLAEDAEFAVNDMKIAEYMENHIGDEFEATIDGTLSKGFFIITDNLISGFVSLENLDGFYSYKEDLMAYMKNGKVAYRLGDRVKVKCIRASKEEKQVDFTVLGKVNRGGDTK